MDSIYPHLQQVLSQESQEGVLFLCSDLGCIDPKKSLAVNLEKLKAKNQITSLHIAECLYHIGRRDVLRDLLHIDPAVMEACIAQRSLFSTFRLALFQASLKLSRRDTLDLVFLTRHVLRPVRTGLSFLSLARALEKLQLIGPTNIEYLASCLDQVGRLDVAHSLRDLCH